MKLAEKLMERKDIVKKISRIKEEVTSNLITQIEFAPKDDSFIKTRLDELTTQTVKLQKVNKEINDSNAKYLSDDLNKLQILDTLINFYKNCRKAMLDRDQYTYSRESKFKMNYDIESINKTLEDFESGRRELDKKIQKMNWEIVVE